MKLEIAKVGKHGSIGAAIQFACELKWNFYYRIASLAMTLHELMLIETAILH